MSAQWFSPICDLVLAKVAWWVANYEKGEINATRQFLDPLQGLIDKPTRYAHKFPWHPQEFDHLVRLVRGSGKNQPLIEELEHIQKNLLLRAQMVPGGGRLITLSFYPEHVKEIYDCLIEARDGAKAATLAEKIEKEGLF